MERMRQTMDRRLSAYEERIGGVNQALEEKLGSNEARLERMRQTIEGGLQKSTRITVSSWNKCGRRWMKSSM